MLTLHLDAVAIRGHGKVIFEPFFEDLEYAELGYELVARILGGKPPSSSDPRRALWRLVIAGVPKSMHYAETEPNPLFS